MKREIRESHHDSQMALASLGGEYHGFALGIRFAIVFYALRILSIGEAGAEARDTCEQLQYYQQPIARMIRLVMATYVSPSRTCRFIFFDDHCHHGGLPLGRIVATKLTCAYFPALDW
jgi:hypothetical protein